MMPEKDESNKLSSEEQLQNLTLQLPDTLYRAYQRCTWMIIHETGRSQHDIMQEMVTDFLVKHGG